MPSLPSLYPSRLVSGSGSGHGQAAEQRVPVHRLPGTLGGVMWRLQQQLVHLCTMATIMMETENEQAGSDMRSGYKQ